MLLSLGLSALWPLFSLFPLGTSPRCCRTPLAPTHGAAGGGRQESGGARGTQKSAFRVSQRRCLLYGIIAALVLVLQLEKGWGLFLA